MEKQKGKKRTVAGVCLLVSAVLLQLAARNISGFATWYARNVYPLLVGSVGRIFGIFPFSVVEIFLYIGIIGLVLYIASHLKAIFAIVGTLLSAAGLCLFLYTCNCGINYFAAPFSSYSGLEVQESSADELYALCQLLAEKVNETAADISYRTDAAVWRAEGVRAMRQAGEKFPALAGYYPKPKQVLCSWILSVQQLCGVYSPFTIEANFNGAMPAYNVPHTICHELSHLRGFMREDEANFIGYLACIGSENQAFQYSGYLMGWVYAGNALARTDAERYQELYGTLCEQARKDLAENNTFWERYEGPVAEASNQVNDTYLKINRQADGVKSYGRAVDLMLAYERQK